MHMWCRHRWMWRTYQWLCSVVYKYRWELLMLLWIWLSIGPWWTHMWWLVYCVLATRIQLNDTLFLVIFFEGKRKRDSGDGGGGTSVGEGRDTQRNHDLKLLSLSINWILLVDHNFLNYLDIDECTNETDGCAHMCTNEAGSYSCSCRSGYQLARDRHGCMDVDECADGTDNCDQVCTNTIGNYTCSCNFGFYLASDGQTCTGKLLMLNMLLELGREIF